MFKQGFNQAPTWALLILVISLSGCAAIRGDAASEVVSASGFIETTDVSIVSEVGGRVAELLVSEGDDVEVGQALLQIDDALLQAQRVQAEAAVQVAEANLRKLRAGASEEDIAAVEAGLAEAEAALRAAQGVSGQAWANASNPISVDLQIEQTQMQIELLVQRIEGLRAQRDQQEFWINVLRDSPNPDGGAIGIADRQMQIIDAQIRGAEAELAGAQQKLAALQEQRERPLAQLAVAQQASAQIPVAEARISLAQAQLGLVLAGPQPQQIAVAAAQVRLAEAQLALVDAQISRLRLYAPVSGVITTRAVAVGETASPGVALLTLSDLANLRLVVYIPQPQIGLISRGMPVQISADAFPLQTFDGMVTLISDEAEFTPRNVQTDEERVNLVFAVEIAIENGGGNLRPGMAADVLFGG